MKQTIYILILLTFSSCSTNEGWENYYAKGIPDIHEDYSTLIFSNDSLGFLGGNRMVYPNQEKNGLTVYTVLYKTIDQGKVWEKLHLNEIGNIEKILPFNDTLIVLNQSIFNSPTILQSNDKGQSWETILHGNKKSYIIDMYFPVSSHGLVTIWDKTNRLVNLLEYKGIANQWDTLKTFPENNYGYRITKKWLFSLIPGELSKVKGISIYNYLNDSTNEILFDKQYEIWSSFLTDNQELFLPAIFNDDISIIIKLKENKLTYLDLGDFKNYSLTELYVQGDLIYVIANQKKNVGPIGVTNELIISEDGGERWSLEQIPFNLIVTPNVLYKNKFYMTSTGGGMFQKKKIK